MRVAGMCQCEQWLSSAPTAQITLQREQADGEHGRGRRGSAGSEQGSGRAKIVSDRRPNTAETDLGVFSFSLAPSERDPAAVPSIQAFLGPTFLAKKKSNESGNLLGTKRRRGIILPSRHCGGKVLAPVHYLSGGLQAGGCKCLLVSATG